MPASYNGTELYLLFVAVTLSEKACASAQNGSINCSRKAVCFIEVKIWWNQIN
jgi:hypothetical protein